MKKIILTLAACIAAVSAFAQEKGQFSVGGMVGLSFNAATSKSDNGSVITKFNDSELTLSLTPEVCYFLEDNIKVGAKLGFVTGSGYNSLTVCPMAGYYLPLADKLYYAPEVSAGIHANFGSNMSSSAGFLFNLAIGNFEYRVLERLALSVNVLSFNLNTSGYKNSINGMDIKHSTVTTGLHFGSPSVGVLFYL